MGKKRHLGLGKVAKSKKQKTDTPSQEDPVAETKQDELTVELNEELDANDDLGQLKALWKVYNEGDKENELVVNGLIHECDRILRKYSNSEELKKEVLPEEFYSIYALALSSLPQYNNDDESKIKQFFDAAIERADIGLEKYAESIALNFTKCKILLNLIPLKIISKLTPDSRLEAENNVEQLLDQALEAYETGESLSESRKDYSAFNEDNFDNLQALDDLLDIVDNFGQEKLEGDESDDEEEEENDPVELGEQHPLHSVRSTDKYNQWWRDHILVFLTNLDKQEEKKDEKLRKVICSKIGQSYLLEAEEPINIFTTLEYDTLVKAKEINGLTKKEARKISQKLVKKAIEYLNQANDDLEPESWVNIAEALISLGNLYELESDDQEKTYKKAEELLVKANNATNGKYENILQNLLNNDEAS